MAGITMSGMNGIDFNTILDAVMEYESQPLKAMQDAQAKVQNQDTAFVSLAGLISALQTPVTSLTSSSAFTGIATTSSDPSIVTAALGDGGLAGQYDVSITQRAKNQVTKSTSGYTAVTDIAATGGSISFTIDGATTDPITISADTTLSELKDLINDQDSGVIASIVNDGTNYKLIISSRETGETHGFTINNSLANGQGTVVAFAVGQNATTGNAQNGQNALLNVNGIDIESDSNTVSDAIPGMTLSLLKVGDASINVSSDYTSLKDSLKAIVTQYNKVRQFNTQQTKGVLGGDPVLRGVLHDIKTVLLTANSNGGRYKYLSEIGLELTSSGDLKLDETKLNTAITSYSDDLEKLFQGNGVTDGALDSLKTTLANLDGSAGLIKTARDGIQTTLSGFKDKIERQQLRLEIRRQELMRQYAAADQAMSRLNQLTASITNLQRSL